MSFSPKTLAATAAVAALLAFGATGCAGSAPADTPATTSKKSEANPSPSESPTPTKTEAPKPVDLSGEWKQSNAQSEEMYQVATIAGSTIEINWVTEGGSTKSLYWAGSLEVPQDGSQTFAWDSKNDTGRTAGAMLASSEPSKKITYADGVLSYEASAMGKTVTVELKRA